MDGNSLDALLATRPHEARARIEAALEASGGDGIEIEWLCVSLLVVDGRYASALARPMVAELLAEPSRTSVDALAARVLKLIEDHAGSPHAAKLATWVGIACLHCVVRANFTGPGWDEWAGSEGRAGEWAQATDNDARAALALDGEEVHRKVGAAWALAAARALLPPADGLGALDTSPWAAWWSARAAIVHSRLLSAQSPTLRAVALAGLGKALGALEAEPPSSAGDELRATLLLEECATHALSQSVLY
ncbi:hypothetical protein T492DRAFT_836760 [Pavlovales sp. CCMP2436]|nr:hypothetical protein T492DRAFT_836760 [Pavlovales sp. CCMP2436]